MSSLVPSSSSHASTPRTSINTDSILSQIDIADHYVVHSELGSGAYGKCVLVTCKQTGKRLVLKLLDKRTTRMKDFLRELNTSIFLSAHPNIIDAYSVAFETSGHFTFTMEQAPLGDLFEFILPNRGLHEATVKCVAGQLAAALDFVHSQGLCHRDLKPENVAVFEPDLSLVKVADFGMCRPIGTPMKKAGTAIPYTPPEIAQAAKNESYRVMAATDVWSFGVLIFCCLTGSFPWQVAKESDCHYHEFAQWQRRKSLKVPSAFREFTPRLQKLLRRLLEPRPSKRAAASEMRKFAKDDWTALVGGRTPRFAMAMATTAATATVANDGAEEVERLGRMLAKCGVSHRVTRRTRQLRVRQWLQENQLEDEEDEAEDEDEDEDEDE